VIVGQVAVGQLGELGRARDRGEAAVDSGAEVENTLGEQIGLLEVEVGLLLVLFVELQVQRAGQVPVRPLVHVVERQEVHRKLLERLHALATLFVTLQGITVFNSPRLRYRLFALLARPTLFRMRRGDRCGVLRSQLDLGEQEDSSGEGGSDDDPGSNNESILFFMRKYLDQRTCGAWPLARAA